RSPQMLDIFLSNNPNLNSPFTEFGGVKGNTQNGFLPTKETALFLIAGDDLQKRIEVIKILQAHHPLYRRQILEVRAPEAGASSLSSPLTISKIALPKILWGGSYIPEFAADFPAKKVVSPLDWEDLVLAPFVMEQILEIKAWLKHESLIQEQWALKKILKPGFRSLFFGPPGTGKTLTASLLGKTLAMDVYRIDLAMVVSKYIGDTEKNLARVFDLAENNQWILFFDEADALFGKRSLTKSSNDRYANQEVSYLLQRIEDFPGLVILASNFKGNLDDAFIRRFQSIIHFPLPGPEQRLALWQKAFSQGLQLGVEVNLEEIAREHEVSGGEIINVLRYVAIKTAEQGAPFVDRETIIQGLNREFQKNGRALGL
ncbi:MAG: ATP-binding protein, partial [Bacteroidota bacterium]